MIMFIATFVRSALGFGDGLIAMPLLTMLIGVEMATPLVALGGSTIAATILLRSWQGVDLKAAWRLIASTLVGIPLGLLFLRMAPDAIVEVGLGIVLIGFGGYSLSTPQLPRLEREWLSYLFGAVAGVLGIAYNTNGPPVVIYGMLRRWSPEQFRATLQGYFLPTGLVILLSHGLAGLWTPPVLRLYGYGLPVIMAGVFTGGLANQRVSGERFKQGVYGFLVLMGALLILRAL